MIQHRPSATRGHFQFAWLDTHHTFSFGDYSDPKYMGYRALRVINDDRIAPGEGFPMHGHKEMEILTWVLQGALEHRDSAGGQGIIRPGDIQRMSAGRGIRHSEFNASPAQPVHLLQIWLLPATPALDPGYEQKSFTPAQLTNRLALLASPDGSAGAVRIHQDARLYVARLDPGAEVSLDLEAQRFAYAQTATGAVELNGLTMAQGDGAAITAENRLTLRGGAAGGEVLLFDLA